MSRRVVSWPKIGLSLLIVAIGGAFVVPTTASAGSTPAPSGTRAAAGSGAPGAAPLGTTNYPIPTGAYFVAATGSDKAAGTQSAPWATIGHAVAAAPNQSTIVIRAGIYRESVTINNKALTIQPYPNEAVIVRGSTVVSGFQQNGSTWVLPNWTYQFPRQNQRAVSSAHPLANAPDQVFVDGNELTQVGKATAVNANSFFVDYTAHQLVIGLNPTGHTIEASTKTLGLELEHAPGTIIRGLQFDEYATPGSTHGAVLDRSGKSVFENDWFMNNATAGLSIQAAGTLVTHDTMANNGQLGLHGVQADGLHVTYCEMKHNNVEGFDEHQEAGGMKLSSSNDVLIDYNLADGNLAKGFWFDIASLRATMVRNNAYSNVDEGFQFEISTGAVIAGNIAWRNGGGGVRVIESQHVDIFNNVLYQNQSAVDVWEGNRPQNVADVTIRNNVIMDGSNGAVALLDIHDFTNTRTAAQMGVSVDADAYCRSTPSQPPQIAAWASGKGQVRFTSLATFVKATGNDTHGQSCDGTAATKMLTNPPAGNFALATGSPGANAGLALPSNVAGALGVASGVPVDLGLLGPGIHTGPGPTITSQPTSVAVLVGQTYSFSAAASGTPRPTVQWQVSPDGVTFHDIPGANTTRYAGVAASTDDGDRLRAVFSNSGGVSISDAATLTVSPISVTIEDPGPQLWGQKFVLVADVSVSGVAPSDVGGSVTFYDGSTKLATHSVTDGVATINAPKFDAGGHSLVAVYKLLKTTASSDPIALQVSPAATTIINLRANHKTLLAGSPLTISATSVVLSPSTGAVRSGTITVYDDGTPITTTTVSSIGHISVITTDLAVGDHEITATYDGDPNYAPSLEAGPVLVTVQ